MTALRKAALMVALAGAGGSAGLTLYAGRHNSSRVLMLLFIGWVLSPFAAAVLASAKSKRWPVQTQAALHAVMLVFAVGSLAVFGYVALGPPRPRMAFVFLVVPLASWLLMSIVVALAGIVSGRRD